MAARSRPGDDETLISIWAPSRAASRAREVPEVLANRNPKPQSQPGIDGAELVAGGKETPLVE